MKIVLRGALAMLLLAGPSCASTQAGSSRSTLAVPVTPAARHDPRRAIVVFGGFGYFDDSRHAWLTDLIRRNADQRSVFNDRGRALEDGVAIAARRILASGVPKWSAHRVVFDAKGLEAAFTAATGERIVDTTEMFTEFDRAYMIVLSSGFEHDAVLRTSYTGGVTYHAYASVSVSASLVDLRNSGDILLSTSVMATKEINQLRTADAPREVWADRYAAAYAAAAERALTQLFALAATSDPDDREKSWDTYMVTGAVVAKVPGPGQTASRRAAETFAWQLADDPINYCAPVNHCDGDSKACTALTGFMVSAMSDALSQAGHKVLPPLTWRDGVRRIDDIARYRLTLPSTPLPELASSTELDFNPKRATYKAVAMLGGVTFSTEALRTGAQVVDGYGAIVDASVSRTDPRTCESLPKTQFFLDRKNVGSGAATDAHPRTEPPIDIDSRRFLYLLAINDATTSIARSLRQR